METRPNASGVARRTQGQMHQIYMFNKNKIHGHTGTGTARTPQVTGARMRLTQFLGKRYRYRGIHFAQLCADDALTGALSDYFERMLASLAPQKPPPQSNHGAAHVGHAAFFTAAPLHSILGSPESSSRFVIVSPSQYTKSNQIPSILAVDRGHEDVDPLT